MSKYLDLAKKLQAMVDRGEGGEKENAYKMLNDLLKERGISLEDIEGEKKTRVWFKYHKHRKLFVQVTTSVLGRSTDFWENKKTRRYQFGLDVTLAQEIEIKQKFSFYVAKYEQDLEIFYAAFINKNNIFPEDSSVGSKLIGELSAEERERNRKILELADALPYHERLKQLNAGK